MILRRLEVIEVTFTTYHGAKVSCGEGCHHSDVNLL